MKGTVILSDDEVFGAANRAIERTNAQLAVSRTKCRLFLRDRELETLSADEREAFAKLSALSGVEQYIVGQLLARDALRAIPRSARERLDMIVAEIHDRDGAT